MKLFCSRRLEPRDVLVWNPEYSMMDPSEAYVGERSCWKSDQKVYFLSWMPSFSEHWCRRVSIFQRAVNRRKSCCCHDSRAKVMQIEFWFQGEESLRSRSLGSEIHWAWGNYATSKNSSRSEDSWRSDWRRKGFHRGLQKSNQFSRIWSCSHFQHGSDVLLLWSHLKLHLGTMWEKNNCSENAFILCRLHSKLQLLTSQ